MREQKKLNNSNKVALKVNIPEDVKRLHKLFIDAKYELYLVGGCVRDSLMGIEPHDWDMCTSAMPEETIRVLRSNHISYYTKGIEYGTIVAVLGNVDYEITTYREDSIYTDGRRPDEVKYVRDLRTDLSRRDFTINAIAMNPVTLEIVDPYCGALDIDSKRLSCVGNAYDRFEEDGLRILRAIRFAIKYGLQIDEETKEAMHNKLGNLDKVAKERVTEEFRKLLCENKVITDIFLEFSDIIAYLIPEIKPCIGFNQNNKYHKHNVYEHLLAVTDLADTNKFEIKLAALLHDIGKPASYVEDADGKGHFYGHPKVSRDICVELLKKDFRLSHEENELVLNLVEFHDEFIANTKKSVKRFLAKHGADFLDDWYVLKKADFDDHIFPNGKENLVNWYTDIGFVKEIEGQLLEEETCFKLSDLAVNGNDIMQKLNLKPSKRVGEILQMLFDKVIDEEVENERNILLDLAVELNDTCN